MKYIAQDIYDVTGKRMLQYTDIQKYTGLNYRTVKKMVANLPSIEGKYFYMDIAHLLAGGRFD